MAEHKQPTAEELEAENQRILAELEKEEKDNTPEPDEEEIPEEKEEEKEEEPSPSKPEEEEENQENKEEENKEEKEESKSPEQIELEEKAKALKESTKESQRLFNQKQIIGEAFEKINDVAEPTEEEMKAKYPTWDTMDDLQKSLATDNVWNNKKLAVLTEASKEVKEHDIWIKKVKTFIDNPEVLNAHPELEGKTDEFRAFAGDPKRRENDLEDLVLTFSGYLAKNRPAPKKGKMFEQGGGGVKEKKNLNDGKISVEDSIVLRETNYKKYRQMLEEGKIAEI